MKICSKCGNILKDEDVFCSKCGAKTSVFGVRKKPTDKTSAADRKSTGYGKLRADTLPGDRYTAAVEQNTVAVTEYLKRATDLEWQKYQIEEIGNKLRGKVRDCEEKIAGEDEAIKSYEGKAEQARTKLKDYKRLEYRRKVFNFKFNFDFKLYAYVFIGLLMIFLIGRVTKLPMLAAGRFNTGLGIVLLLLIPAIVVAFAQAVKYYRDKLEHEKKEDEADAKYSEEQEQLEKETLESLNNDIADYSNIIKEHENEKARLENIVLKELNYELGENAKALQKNEKDLETYYSIQALYPKYRSLVPVSTMYGYFDSGRTIDLTGHDGAYGLYEKELRYKNITEDLAEILQKSEATAGDQAMILKKVSETGRNVSELMNKLDAVIQKHLDSNPDGYNVSTRLRHTGELEKFYENAESLGHDYTEYTQTLSNASRRWF